MPNTQNGALALFDLDGTLVPWDTQMLFSNYIVRRFPLRRAFLIPFLCCIPFYLLRLCKESTMKRVYLGYLRGLPLAELEKLAESFVREEVLPICYEEVCSRLKAHQEKGDFCILVSASPTLYAKYVAKELGFDEFLGSDTENIDPFPFFPKMPFGNNKGWKKVQRLQAMGYLPEEQNFPRPHSIAYSDSSADLPMLLSCEKAVLVNPSDRLRKYAEDKPWEIVTPKRPWKGKLDKLRKICLQLLGLFKQTPSS